MSQMIPMGYMAKRICERPAFLSKVDGLVDIYSVGACVNDDFAEFVNFWKHNGYWFFNSPADITDMARENSIDLGGTTLFYYEAHPLEFTGELWRPYSPWSELTVKVIPPAEKLLEGFDVVTFWTENSPAPEHSPLSCNGLAEEIAVNSHCLIDSFEEAERSLINGKFNGGEPGPSRIFAVYSVAWSKSGEAHQGK